MSVEAELILLEEKRCRALREGDIPALDRLLSERLIFTHANALADTKQQLLDKLRQGGIVYRHLDISEARVVEFSGCAILLSRLTADVDIAGVRKRIDNRTLSVWALEAGHYRLIAYQPTPISASKQAPLRP